MNNLIKTQKFESIKQTINARDLWKKLGKPQGDFNLFISRYLLNAQYDFKEGQDFYTDMCKTPSGHETKIYELTFPCAIALSALQRNEVGNKIRRELAEKLEQSYEVINKIIPQLIERINNNSIAYSELENRIDNIEEKSWGIEEYQEYYDYQQKVDDNEQTAFEANEMTTKIDQEIKRIYNYIDDFIFRLNELENIKRK